MKTWVRKTLSVGVLAAGALLFGSGAAYAGEGHNGTSQHSGNNNGILNGTQVIAPIDIPVNVAGIGLGILGQGTGVGAASSESGWTEHGKVKQHSGNNNGILNGTQVYAPIDIPVNVAGVGVGVLGQGTGSGVATSGGHSTEGGKVKQHSGNNNGILNGTQAYLPINVPINLAGIGVGILGQGTGVGAASSESGWTEHGKVKQHSGNNNGILNGTQVYAPIDIPVNVAGVGLGILGQGTGSGVATSGGHSTEGASQVSGDNEGILNGTQILAPINAPINVCGIGIGVLGQGTGAAVCSSGDHDDNDNGGDDGDHDGDDDDVDGDHGDDDGDYGDAPRGARAASTEASPVDGLTQGATGGLNDTLNGAGLNLGGVPLLNTLR